MGANEMWREYHAASRFYPGTVNAETNATFLQTLQSEGQEKRFSTSRPLTPISDVSRAGIVDLLARRCSTRTFSGAVVSQSVIDTVVTLAFIRTTGDDTIARRPTPSAGALYPIELYLATRTAEGHQEFAHLAAHPRRAEKRWAVLPDQIEFAALDEALLHQLPDGASGAFFLSAHIAKSVAKYGERGYRFCLLEAGHIAQNVVLALELLNVHSICLGAFADHLLNRLLHMDGYDEAVVYAIPFGIE